MSIPLLALMLDLVGTFVFALSGAMLAVRARLDIFGILVLSLAAGLAGGLIRDVLIGAETPAAFEDSRLLLAALGAGIVTFFGHRIIEKLTQPVMLLDAIGLGVFAVSGCRKALLYGLDPLPAILLGVLTAIGGGVLRDLLVIQVPRVLEGEVYALAALLAAVIVIVGAALGLPDFEVALFAVALSCLLRVISVKRGWRAPRAPGS